MQFYNTVPPGGGLATVRAARRKDLTSGSRDDCRGQPHNSPVLPENLNTKTTCRQQKDRAGLLWLRRPGVVSAPLAPYFWVPASSQAVAEGM